MPSGQWGDDIEDFRHVIRSVFQQYFKPINDDEIILTLELLKDEVLMRETVFKDEESKNSFLQLIDMLLNNVKSLGDKQKFIIYLLSDLIVEHEEFNV